MNLITRVLRAPSSLLDVNEFAQPLSLCDDLTPRALFLSSQQIAWYRPLEFVLSSTEVSLRGLWERGPLGLLDVTINQALSLGHIFCIINLRPDRHFGAHLVLSVCLLSGSLI